MTKHSLIDASAATVISARTEYGLALTTPVALAPPHLSHAALALTHAETLSTPRQRYGLAARALFIGLDVFYGRPRTLEKFRVLELIARVPYQAWEQVAYVATTHVHQRADLARRIYDRVLQARSPQHNEQW